MNKKTVVALVTAALIAAAAVLTPVKEVLVSVCAKVEAPVAE